MKVVASQVHFYFAVVSVVVSAAEPDVVAVASVVVSAVDSDVVAVVGAVVFVVAQYVSDRQAAASLVVVW